MGRTGSTKNTILGMIAKKERTLSEISDELGLSPSTVSQHLHELEADGAIKSIENTHIRKWKYYGLTEDMVTASKGKNMTNNKTLLYYGGGVVVIAAIALLVLSMQNAGGGGLRGYLNVPISLTDPPHVPVGTSALTINYNSVQVHLSSAANSSGWLSANTAGAINLMTLLNVSQTIGNVGLPANASVNLVRFEISSASIMINGTLYNVTVPSSQVTARLEGSVNSSAGILLDLSPTVATIFTQNSTIFVMVPSLRAVVVGQANTTPRVGERRNLNRNESDALDDATPMISISNASLLVNGNATSLSITVKNNANQSVMLKHILVFGNESATVSARTEASIHVNSSSVKVNASIQSQTRPSVIKLDESALGNNSGSGSSNGSGKSNIGINAQDSANISTSLGTGDHGNVSASANSQVEVHASDNSSGEATHSGLNSTESGHGNESVSQNQTAQEHEGENRMNITVVARTIQELRTMNFLAQSNSTSLLLPFAQGEFSGEGHLIPAGASVTFTFSGNVSTGDSHIMIRPIAGDIYRIEAIGEQSSFAAVNVTAR